MKPLTMVLSLLLWSGIWPSLALARDPDPTAVLVAEVKAEPSRTREAVWKAIVPIKENGDRSILFVEKSNTFVRSVFDEGDKLKFVGAN